MSIEFTPVRQTASVSVADIIIDNRLAGHIRTTPNGRWRVCCPDLPDRAPCPTLQAAKEYVTEMNLHLARQGIDPPVGEVQP